ncbi:GNAT family N-acetyltransferase [Pseudomonas cremoricolorata]|uniref:GNAT family N-acetyltransferase n=1 Tax=Pseudomonas cremoricolorata TaxID=157783 RepID=UPI0009DD0DE5|nr:GNAT family N-acetyltransferase [Pseudomonas cremoricolorata]
MTHSSSPTISDHTTSRPAAQVIRILEKHELPSTLPLLCSVYPYLSIDTLQTRMDVIANATWQCAGVFQDGQLVALSGFWVNTRLYCGKYLYIDHFIVQSEQRSLGVGSHLLAYMKQQAEALECEQICLDTFVTNRVAQRFWSRHGFHIVGFHYVSE